MVCFDAFCVCVVSREVGIAPQVQIDQRWLKAYLNIWLTRLEMTRTDDM